MISRSIRSSLLAVSSLAAMTSAALAQQSAQQTAQAGGLEEIVVTAQRREQNLQSVPMAVTALTADTLARNDVRDLSRVEVLTPGFSWGKSGSDARPAIRGVRTENVAVSGDPTIGFFVDNVYRSRASQANEPFVDVERVEVQRGPQGTLYGRNTFGGNIALATAAPSAEQEAGVDFTFGRFGRTAASGYANLPVSDTLQFRVAGLWENMDGYVKGIDEAHDIFDRDTTYFRIAGRLAPNDEFEATLRYSMWDEGGTGGAAFGYRVGGAFVNPTTGALDIRGTPVRLNIGPTEGDGIPDFAGIDLGRPIDPRGLFYPGDTILEQELKQHSVSLNMSYDFGAATLRSITGYVDYYVFRNADNDFTAVARNVDAQEDDLNSTSQELQLASNGTENFEWIFGYYYFNEDIKFSIFSSCPSGARNTAGCAFAAGFPETTSNAGFGEVSYWIAPDRVRLTGGIRYTEDKKEITRFAATTDARQRVNSLTSTGQQINFKFNKTTWRVNAEYHLDSGNMLYASVSTGFRSGGFNGGSLTNPALPAAFRPENVRAYELGSKNRLLDNRLVLNLSAYRNNFKDLQVQNQFIIVGAAGTTTTSVILNAAEAHSEGVELELQALPTDELSLAMSATIMSAEFDTYRNTPAPARYTGFLDLSGNDIPYSPNFKLTGSVSYSLDLGGSGTLTPQVTMLHSGSYQLTDFNTALDKQDSFTKLDVRVEWRSEDDRYSVAAFVNNATNEITLNRATFGSRGLNSSFDAPRMWGARVGARF
ncbi:MAG: TonB-dependent receptor [Rhodospirillaceae bacterium]|nr:TonB-dependent receptor [Rhodospirillaceae bacterium]